MLADNIVLLKKEYPVIYQLVKNYEEKAEKSAIIVEKAKDGKDTLKYQSAVQTVYFHSKYDPIREAETIIQKFAEKENISSNEHVVFYGLGLGYHIEVFINRFPGVSFSIVEPSVDVFSAFLNCKRLKKIATKNLISIQCGNNPQKIYEKVMQSNNNKLVFCEHPVYPKIFIQNYKNFLEAFKTMVKEQKTALHTNYAFKKRWIVNSVNNLKEVLSTPNILNQHNDIFKGKIAILVAAGPSLDFEIDNLKKIKEEGLAYIFSVGSAINSLIHHEIYPDAMCTYDPTEKNQLVFKKLNEFEIDSIPMIFGSSVGFEVLEQYHGPKFHMITSQDTIADYFLKPNNGVILEKVYDAPSIAVVTIELLVKLGFEKIVLVGQNLGYLDNKYYSEGISNKPIAIVDCNSIAGVDGNNVKTNESFLSMKKLIELTISRFNANVINTTIGGVHIDGTEFCLLEDLIKRVLTRKHVSGSEFDQIIRSEFYNKKHMFEKLGEFEKAFQEYEDVVKKIRYTLEGLKQQVKQQNQIQTLESHKNLNELILFMEKNDFFKTVALPLNRVEYGILRNHIENYKQHKDSIFKTKSILKPTETFINHLDKDCELNSRIMIVLKNTIVKHHKEIY